MLASASAPEREYLFELESLKKNSFELQIAPDRTYNECIELMKKIAAEHGIIKPKLAVGYAYKEGLYPYPWDPPPNEIKEIRSINDHKEWDQFFKNAKRFQFPYISPFYIVDDSKFWIVTLSDV